MVGLTNIVGIDTNRFDTSPPGLYSVGGVVDSWTVLTNPVTVVDSAAIADTLSRFVALSTGAVTRTLPTVAGQLYAVTFRYRVPNSPAFNGSFENPPIPGPGNQNHVAPSIFGGWTVESSEVDRPPDWDAADGLILLDMHGNSASSQGIIYQDIPTVPGVVYQLSFAFSANPISPIPTTFDAFWAGVLQGSQLFDPAAVPGLTFTNLTWAYTNYPVVGSGNDRLRFASTTAPSSFGPLLDDVRLSPIGSALVDVGGVVATNINGTNSWQTFTATFTAIGPTAMTIAGIDGGMLIDSFVLSEVQLVSSTLFTVFSEDTNTTSRPMKYGVAPFIDNGLASPALTNYFLPEEPMTALRGQNAVGDWRLEIWDNRLGAPLGTLLNWQLSITYANAAPTITPLFNGQCVTGTVAGVGRQYFAVVVPGAATIGTNTLTTFGGPVNLDFNQNFLPIGGGPGDVRR